MKANEMPERIYIFDYNDAMVTPLEGDTTYVREDAFIEKVESFLNRKDDRDSYTIGYIRRHLKEIIKEVGL